MTNFFIKIFTLVIISLSLPIMILIFFFLFIHGINPIYKAKRIGKNQKIFTMYKFRSLKPNLVKGYLTTSKDESFFYFSNFFRNSKLDELPQLFNILFGTMNWVGPRPNDPRIVMKYKKNDRKKIFSVKPGLTDFSTLIFGIRSDNFIMNKNEKIYFKKIEKEKIYYRKIYINQKNFKIDIKIIFFTILSYLGIVQIKKKNFNFFFK
jgi:lipopolysaccharide/colanic/teichoic acid biosynthesis glycosyltransferase